MIPMLPYRPSYRSRHRGGGSSELHQKLLDQMEAEDRWLNKWAMRLLVGFVSLVALVVVLAICIPRR